MEDKKVKVSYAFYKILKFSEYKSVKQETMGYEEPSEPESLIKIEFIEENKMYKAYKVSFDKKINQQGYFYNFNNLSDNYELMDFDHYYEANSFKAYVFESEGYVLFNTSYKKTDFLFRMLGALMDKKGRKPISKCQGRILLEKINFNGTEIVSKIEMLTGTWWQMDNEANLSTQATFGKNVDNSIAFKEIKKQGGKITSLNFVEIYNNEETAIILSTRGSISILNKINENISLNLARSILKKLIL